MARVSQVVSSSSASARSRASYGKKPSQSRYVETRPPTMQLSRIVQTDSREPAARISESVYRRLAIRRRPSRCVRCPRVSIGTITADLTAVRHECVTNASRVAPRASVKERDGRAHVRGCGHEPSSPSMPAALRARLTRSATIGPSFVGSSSGLTRGPRCQPSAIASVWPLASKT